MSVLVPLPLCLSLALVLLGPAAAQDGPPAEPPAGSPQEPPTAPGAEGEAAPVEGQDPAAHEVEVPPPALDASDLAFEGALVGAKDGGEFSDDPGYRRLLELVARYQPDELIQKARRDLDHADSLRAPEAWRGEIVHVRGLVVWLQAMRFAKPFGEHTDRYRAIVAETDGSEGVVVDFLVPPPELDIGRDVVEVEGVFYRTVQYENEKDAMAVAPYLIARSLRKLAPEELPGTTSMDLTFRILLGAALAFAALRVLMTVRRVKARRNPSKI